MWWGREGGECVGDDMDAGSYATGKRNLRYIVQAFLYTCVIFVKYCLLLFDDDDDLFTSISVEWARNVDTASLCPFPDMWRAITQQQQQLAKYANIVLMLLRAWKRWIWFKLSSTQTFHSKHHFLLLLLFRKKGFPSRMSIFGMEKIGGTVHGPASISIKIKPQRPTDGESWLLEKGMLNFLLPLLLRSPIWGCFIALSNLGSVAWRRKT